MSKVRTISMIISDFGFGGLFRAVLNRMRGKPVLLNVITEEYVKKNNIIKESKINDDYVENAPCAQNIIDIFKDQWYSTIPIEGVTSGTYALFDKDFDERVVYCNNAYPIEGRSVLELGPFECGHTYQLEQFGASSVTSVEANKLSFLKCLIVKDLLKLNADLLYGDFRKYLKNCDKKYDLVFCAGVLYHMTDPVELLSDISKVADNVYIYTHYYSEDRLDTPCVFDPEPLVLSEKYSGYKHYYEYPGDSGSIVSGGTRNYGVWMKKEDILGLLNDLGFSYVVVLADGDSNPNGNDIAIYAGR